VTVHIQINKRQVARRLARSVLGDHHSKNDKTQGRPAECVRFFQHVASSRRRVIFLRALLVIPHRRFFSVFLFHIIMTCNTLHVH
jgi:hypothetical protein